MNYITKPKEYFTQVSNWILTDNKVSLKAKGLYTYFLSKPNNFQFSADRIALECKEERKAILAAIKELEDNNYLDRKKGGDGRIEYVFYNFPGEKTKVPKEDLGPKVPKRHCAETGPINNTVNDNNTLTISSDFENFELDDTRKQVLAMKGFDLDLYDMELLNWKDYVRGLETPPKNLVSSFTSWCINNIQQHQKLKKGIEDINTKKTSQNRSGEASTGYIRPTISKFQYEDETREEFDQRIDNLEQMTGEKYIREYSQGKPNPKAMEAINKLKSKFNDNI